MPQTVETTTIHIPRDIRPIPDFFIDIPSDWQVTEFPGYLLAASTRGDIDADDWFNLFINHDRIVIGTHDDVFSAQGVTLDLEGVDVEAEKVSEVDGRWLVRITGYADPNSGLPVKRIDASAIAPNKAEFLTEDMITLSFVSPASLAANFEPIIESLVESFRFA